VTEEKHLDLPTYVVLP